MYERLQKLNICLSHQMTVKLVNTLGNNFDKKVLQWMDALAKFIGSEQEVRGVTNGPMHESLLHQFLY